MQSNYLNQSNQNSQSFFPQQSQQNQQQQNQNQQQQQQQHHQQQQQQQFGAGGSNSNNNQFNNGSPSMRGSSIGNYNNNNNNNSNNNNSPFGNQAQFGAGQSTLPSAFGEKAKKNYLPGYLSGGAMGAQSEAVPLQDESRTWDSPASRGSMSGGSPISRFGNQSLFGNRDGTPSRSPKTNLYTQQPRTTAYRAELEEDAPPVESLSEFDAGNDSMMSQSDSSYDNRRPAPNSTNSNFKSTEQSTSSTSSSSSSPGYSLHLFGFPSTSLPLVLEHFSQFGEIISSIPSTQGGNWVTITYSQPTSALRASRKNGTIIGGVLMIGVKVVDEENLKLSLGIEGLNNGISSESNTNPNTRPSTPSTRGPPSGVGKPVAILQANSAFRSAAPTPPRKGFFASGAAGGNGTGVDAQAGLFAEKNRQALLAQGQQEGSNSLLSKASEMIFGW